MLTINQLISEVGTYSRKIENATRSQLFEEVSRLIVSFRAGSPKDTGNYRGNWMIIQPRMSGSDVAFSIVNRTPYGFWLEGGAEKGGPPWFFPSTGRARTGKLFVYRNRVYAGGLNPGKQESAGGVIGPRFLNKTNLVNGFTNRMADAAVSSIR